LVLQWNLPFSCDRCTLLGGNDRWGWKSHCVKIEPSKGVGSKISIKSEICLYDINVRFCYALQLMGIGGEHAVTLASFLDLPGVHKWNRQVTMLEEKFTNPVIEKVKKYAQQKGTDEEIMATINETDNPMEQNLLEAEIPLHCLQVSYDMGWQVCSLGI
jgi:hypothetical protein